MSAAFRSKNVNERRILAATMRRLLIFDTANAEMLLRMILLLLLLLFIGCVKGYRPLKLTFYFVLTMLLF